MSTEISPLAPKSYPDMPVIEGVRFSTAAAGIKYKGRTDVLLVLLDEGTEVAGVFTRSLCPSAPVDWCRANLPTGRARALLVNSGNANAFTGKKGKAAVELSAGIVGKAVGCADSEIYLASTGVIGEPLPADRFTGVIDALVAGAAAGSWLETAKAIMTTDTFPKVATRTVDLGGTPVTLNGIAKGAGMIAPDMATMLSFLFTDAPIAAPVLQALLSEAVGGSFNAITVDSDTSTSDTALLFATGKAAARGAPTIADVADPRLSAFRTALGEVMLDLAHHIVRDGEGARKFVEVRVEGAVNDASAKRIALSIANSPLVKTAIAGEDANWGRVVMAVGKAGEPADRDRLAIWFGDVRVAVDGERDPDYSEAAASAVMEQENIAIRVNLGLGDGTARVWTCDLTKAYVEINGDYRS
ncbi:bifunctional glutamate N-acetyltransferase/amino-acid acetyltransferase ArgJ [Microvirga tunisiensis]|uniref:Bifunctional glutamate N-acetyltransferase/amino-acid acetyltransferase ArgJ n=2 Tax=Pannonibacter tanglangensis TaxID=2750084 RepID=A0ABW9ZM81_9HYPH|nr:MULTISPECIES: bifunctional glutamate N-acetyltransferase/amino-acid acetyltransferase ArgJ [unclassified Pannonibacter]NBN66023.1 bifunctional glutamate N-acetyltransferase/amino-acid acetyltransferase ArgJ [Pannonibacter sp. XCT-34]NBN80518.1 bifunctional glutamate N-acetyltransferase/amino-acid acetyltransferase ArgJ [Pannonibacter sp. XCT-53]